MRNGFAIYEPHTDLRGKKVELRNEKVVKIPKYADREYHTRFIAYKWEGAYRCYQNTSGKTCPGPEDIMKVVK